MIVLPIVLGSALAVPAATNTAALDAATTLPTLSALSAVAIQEEEEGPDGLWHGSVNLGLSKSEGNADIETYALNGTAVREFDIHRYTLEALWYYATQDDIRTQRRALGTAKYDQFFSEKTYFFVNGLIETNEQALLDLRWAAGVGVGHQWRDDDEWKIGTEAGLSYFNEEFDDGTDTDYLAARLAWNVFKQISETLAFSHTGEIFPSLEDADDVYGRATTYVETMLTERMTARLSWLINWDNTPAAGQERTDNLYLLNVGWVF